MHFTWKEYAVQDAPLLDSWLDEEARANTGVEDGFDDYCAYWFSQEETKVGENFWVKLFCLEGVPVGVVAIALWEGVFTVSELLVDPARRGQGLGSMALRELLEHGKVILGVPVASARAVIFPDNLASQKAFEKAGFRFEQAHPDGDAWYYRYDRFSIRPIDRENLQEMLPRLFAILHSNMSVIAPTGNSYEEDEALWCSCIEEAMKKEARQLLVMWDGEAIAGFFMYYTNGSLWMMEEIQIAPAYQGSGLFRALYAYLFATLPDSVESVEAYANKQNQKSIAILKHLGLEAVGESKNGNNYHFRGTYKNLKEALT